MNASVISINVSQDKLQFQKKKAKTLKPDPKKLKRDPKKNESMKPKKRKRENNVELIDKQQQFNDSKMKLQIE